TRFSRDWSSDVCSSDLPWHGLEVHHPGEHLQQARNLTVKFDFFEERPLFRPLHPDRFPPRMPGTSALTRLENLHPFAGFRMGSRSEERRVGKACDVRSQ